MHNRSPSHFLMGLLLLSTTACTSGVSSRADPFAGGTASGGRNRPAVRVGLEVICNQCLITFVAGGDRGSARPVQDDQVWSYRFVRYPIGQETIELRATTAAGNSLDRVRIFVNGDVVASDENEAGAERMMLCASTVIPIPKDADGADAGRSCGPG
jgi:hypothetical protein